MKKYKFTDILRMCGVGFVIIMTIIIIILMEYMGQRDINKYQETDTVLLAVEDDEEAELTEREKFKMTQVRQPTKGEAEEYPLLTNLPALYITTDYRISKINKEEYLPATYTLVYEDGSGIYDQPMMIKGRGNFQWAMPKKPYTIKLGRDADLLGMKSARKWNILGEYIDKTLLRNYLTFWLSSAAGLYTLDCRFIDVFLNGKYNGNYLITEAIQIHENRIDIDKNTEGLFEIEAVYRHDNHKYCVEMFDGYYHVMYKKPDEEDMDIGLKLENLERFKVFFKELDKSLTEGYDAYSKYIDVDSFLNWYIVNEFCKNYDSNFTSSCYCYIKDGKVYMGPVWDYHTCYGSQIVATCLDPKGFHVNGSPWYSTLTNDKTFSRLIRERWTQLRKDRVLDDFVKNLYSTAEYIKESRIINFELWPDSLKDSGLRGDKSRYTYNGEIEYLLDWIEDRIDWLDEQWYEK